MSAPQPRQQRYTRKELLTWKKPKLIREGKKYKLRLTGTKNEMINKLLEAMDNQLANKRKSKSSKKKSTIKKQSNKHQSSKKNKIVPDPTMSSEEKKTQNCNNDTNPAKYGSNIHITSHNFNNSKGKSCVIVYGYCHRCKFSMVPPEIMDIVLCFYFTEETWDADLNSALTNDQYFQIINETTVKSTMDSQHCTYLNVFGKNEIVAGKWQWRLKIVQHPDVGWIVFGVIGSKSYANMYPMGALYDEPYGYAYYNSGEVYHHYCKFNAELEKFDACKKGDIVTVKIDLDNWSLKFEVNDVKTNKFISLKHDKYKLVVAMSANGGIVEIIE